MPEPDRSSDAADVVDEHHERFIDRFAQGAVGTAAGAAMLGLEKGMGLYRERELAPEVRESGEPEDDPDDPIEVSIDPDHPENSRIVFHVRSDDESEP